MMHCAKRVTKKNLKVPSKKAFTITHYKCQLVFQSSAKQKYHWYHRVIDSLMMLKRPWNVLSTLFDQRWNPFGFKLFYNAIYIQISVLHRWQIYLQLERYQTYLHKMSQKYAKKVKKANSLAKRRHLECLRLYLLLG